MVLRRFEKPHPMPRIPGAVNKPVLPVFAADKPEEIWLTTAFLYRNAGSLSPWFVEMVRNNIGVPFRIVGEKTSQSAVLTASWDPAVPMPKITGDSDFWITSFMHLRTSWGGTFPKQGKNTFHVTPAEDVSVEFNTSVMAEYRYSRTDDFEAIELHCAQATILLVLPPANSSIEQMEAAIAAKPDMIESTLARREGDVSLPPFHFTFEADLRGSLERLGIRKVFTDLKSLAPIAVSGGRVKGIAQKTEITLDANGIRADSGMILSGVIGGIGVGEPEKPPEPFHMILDRPFLFFIRDNVTRALIFEGALMNPALQ
jgi:serpin B